MKRPRKRGRKLKARAGLRGEGWLADGLEGGDRVVCVIDPEQKTKLRMRAGIDFIDALARSGNKIEGEDLAKLREARATFVLYANKFPLSPTAQGFVSDALELVRIAQHDREKMGPALKARSTAARDAVIDDAMEKVLLPPQFRGSKYKITELEEPVAKQLKADGHLDLAKGLKYRQVYDSHKRVLLKRRGP